MSHEERTLLIVDDTPENIAALKAILEGYGRIKAATTGEKALRICTAAPIPDLVFLDIQMPGMDGWQVLERLRADTATQDIPVVFVTASADEENERRAVEMGAAAVVKKPLDPEEIRDLVDKITPRFADR